MQVHQSIGIPGSETLSLVRRTSAQAIEILKDDTVGQSPFGSLALHVAVEKCVVDLVQAGERDSERLCKQAVAMVLAARKEHP